jgi:hypothetical protein
MGREATSISGFTDRQAGPEWVSVEDFIGLQFGDFGRLNNLGSSTGFPTKCLGFVDADDWNVARPKAGLRFCIRSATPAISTPE